MKISVIIPAYHAEKTLTDTVQSALGQVVSTLDEHYPRGAPWPDGPALVERLCWALGPQGEPYLLGPYLDAQAHPLEILIVDDGSKDGTLALAHALAAAPLPPGVTIRPLTKPNGGPASARNLGIREATGDLIAFLDADDLWLPAKLARQVAALEATPEAAMVYSDTLYFRHTGIYHPPGVNLKHRKGGWIFEDLLLRGNFVPNLTVLARRDALLAVQHDRKAQGPLDEDPILISSEDYELWMQLAARAPILYLPQPLAWYRVAAGSLNNRRMAASHEASRAARQRAMELPRAQSIPRHKLREVFASTWYAQGYEYDERSQKRMALRCFTRSMLIQPNASAVKGMVHALVTAIPGLRPPPRQVVDRGKDYASFF
jgi:glycosyltransferase involved in cell wall biosynthesis